MLVILVAFSEAGRAVGHRKQRWVRFSSGSGTDAVVSTDAGGFRSWFQLSQWPQWPIAKQVGWETTHSFIFFRIRAHLCIKCLTLLIVDSMICYQIPVPNCCGPSNTPASTPMSRLWWAGWNQVKHKESFFGYVSSSTFTWDDWIHRHTMVLRGVLPLRGQWMEDDSCLE